MSESKIRIIDISSELLDSTAYGSIPKAEMVLQKSIKNGDDFNLSFLKMSVHSGTHIDFPYLCSENGKTADEYPPERFIGECRVVKARGMLTASWIEEMSLYKCERLLIKSGGRGKIDRTAAEELVMQGVKLVGIDSETIGIEGQDEEVHKILLGGDCLIIEGLDLEEAEMDSYYLITQPLLIYGADAAPCRPILIKDYLYWNKK